MNPRTLSQCLSHAAESDRCVRFIDRRGRQSDQSYTSIWDTSRRVGAALTRRGLSHGDRVAILFSNEADFYHAFFGILEAGGIPCPMPPSSGLGGLDSKDAVTARLDALEASLVVAPQNTLNTLRSRLPGVYARVSVSLDELEPDVETLSCGIEPAPQDLALIQFSSGTTGRPKAVGLSHRQLLTNIDAMLDWILAAHPERGFHHSGVSWLPLYHDMGLVGAALTAVVRAGPLTLMAPERFVSRPSSWLWAIATEQATISPGPNFAFESVVERIADDELVGLDLSCWKLALCGAEPISSRTLSRFAKKLEPYGFEPSALTPVYGMAEAGLAVSFSPARRRVLARHFEGDALRRDGTAREHENGLSLVSVGEPIAGVSLRVVNDSGDVLPGARLGRILVRGDSVIREYYRSASVNGSTKASTKPPKDNDGEHGVGGDDCSFPDGWLDTGDLGFIYEGELYLFGRRKELIIVRGRNYAPLEIEAAAFKGLDKIGRHQIAALAAYDPVGQCERVVLVVEGVKREGDSASVGIRDELEESLIGNLAQRLGIVPWRVIFLDNERFPRTSSGKLQRARLMDRIPEPTSTEAFGR